MTRLAKPSQPLDQSPTLSPATLAWAVDGTPWSVDYGDIYHSTDGGLGQARHVFLAGNGLLESGEEKVVRWRGRTRFVIVETGFGLGLNFLATWQAWRDDPQRCDRLHFISFEKHPFRTDDLAQVHAAWPELAGLAAALQKQWPTLLPGAHRLCFDDDHVILTLFFGDAAELLPKLRARVDAFYLDGFSPAKNPDLWSPRIYSSLARLAVTGATLATWSVAGAVRKALADTGFLLEKSPGFGGKREMTRGIFRIGNRQAASSPERHAIILGAGMAGCAVAQQLAARSWRIELIDAAEAPARGASGNHAAVLRPLPSSDDNLLARWTRAGFLHLRRHLQNLEAFGQHPRWQDCGVLHLARDPGHEASQRLLIDAQQPPADYLQFADRETACQLAGWPVAHGGWWFPGGGWVNPASLCQANLNRCGDRLTTHFAQEIVRFERIDNHWQVFNATGKIVASAPTLILANAQGALPLLAPHGIRLPLRPARGQVSHLDAQVLDAPDVVVCRLGYVTPIIDGLRSIGASFIADDAGLELRPEDHADNLSRLEFSLPGSSTRIHEPTENLAGRAGVRSMTQDRLPLVGALPAPEAFLPGKQDEQTVNLADIRRAPGLYGILGFGARGLVWSELAAELLASQINVEPLSLEADLVEAIDPARFLLRRTRRALAVSSKTDQQKEVV